MSRLLHFSLPGDLPDPVLVLRHRGLPDPARLPARIRALLDAAYDLYCALGDPRGVVEEVTREEFAAVYAGEGKNVSPAPLDDIAPRSDALALYAATVGDAASARASTLFADQDPALGYMYDAVVSEAADLLSDRMATAFAADLAHDGRATAETRVLPYSPGYCGWDVTGQARLFACLSPERVGITLGASGLMHPLKSVSGVLIAGSAALHVFRPVFRFCRACGTHECRARTAASLEA